MCAERIDLHTHSLLGDGDLLPSELIRRAVVEGYAAIGIADHGDASNLEILLEQLGRWLREQSRDFPITVIPSVELTYVSPERIPALAHRARELGAGLVLVHGETMVEPVQAGTNRAAVECRQVDILAHPGMITLEEARIAKENGVYLEISARRGHSLANGHVAQIARASGALLVVGSDAHSPEDLVDQDRARAVARGAGLNEDEVQAAMVTNPQSLLERALLRMGKLV